MFLLKLLNAHIRSMLSKQKHTIYFSTTREIEYSNLTYEIRFVFFFCIIYIYTPYESSINGKTLYILYVRYITILCCGQQIQPSVVGGETGCLNSYNESNYRKHWNRKRLYIISGVFSPCNPENNKIKITFAFIFGNHLFV